MKKFLNISVIALVAMGSLGLSSCNHEEDDIFNENAANRLAGTITTYSDILTQNGGKWELEYFTTSDEPGYVYVMTFNKNGTVTMAGQNEWIGKSKTGDPSSTTPYYASETSLWEVITDNGPVLSFNSYNSIFHLFADPADLPSTTVNEAGHGHNGDYEFDIMKYSDNGDTLYLQGKKHEVNMVMTRIPATTDDQTYMSEVTAMADSFFNANIAENYINLPGGSRYVVLNGATSIMSVYPENGDPIVQTTTHNFIITRTGLSLMSPMVLHDSIDGNDYSVQHFVRQADGSLLCTDDNKTTITADYLSGCVASHNMSWKLALGSVGLGGRFLDEYNTLVTDMKAFNTSVLSSMHFGWNASAGRYELTFPFTFKNSRKQTVKATGIIIANITRVDHNTVKFSFDFDDPVYSDTKQVSYVYGKTYYNNVPGLKTFIDDLAATSFSLTTTDLLAPIAITMADQGNAESFIKINVYNP